MSATVLSLIQQATGEMGLSVPTSVVGNSTQDVVQLLALANAVGNELQREHDWQAITNQYRFTTSYLTTTGTVASGSAVVTSMGSTTGLDANYQAVGSGINNDTYVLTNDSSSQVTLTQNCTASATGETITFTKVKYSPPSDFDRIVDRTQWDKSKHWEMIGPETAQQREWLKSGYISTGPRIRWWFQNGTFQIWPAIGSAEYLGYEYVSQYWVTASGGTSTTKSSFTVDTDTCIFPDRLMVIGIKKKYFEVKGFDTTAFQDAYNRQLDIAKANDTGAPNLSFAPRISTILIGWENIPDSNYGS